MRTITNPKDGKTIETLLTSEKALDILMAKGKGSFVQSLITSYPRLSRAQEYYFFKSAEEIINPQTNTNSARVGVKVGAGFMGIKGLFDCAISKGLKRPKIRLQNDGREVILSLAPAASVNADHIYIKVNGLYCGKITPEGSFLKSRECVEGYLASFAENPAKVASDFGHLTGRCSFCGLELTDERSVSVGRGPICSSKFGLPWGN